MAPIHGRAKPGKRVAVLTAGCVVKEAVSGRPVAIIENGASSHDQDRDAGWVDFFKQAGYAALTPDWPDDPATVEEARANPDVFAKKTLKQIAEHTTEVINASRGLSGRSAFAGFGA